MIRLNVDRRLPDGQWPVLQTHLENCASCRAYNLQLHSIERDLRRVVRGRAGRVPDSSGGLLRGVLAARQRKTARSNRLMQAVGLLAAALVVFLILRGALAPEPARGGDAGASAALPATATPRQTATPFPTAQVGQFAGVVAYTSRQDGNTEIYLLNPGAEPANLTDHPGEDLHPAWSPDGEWLAFLSDRQPARDGELGAPPGGAGPKTEVYVMHISGTRLVRLTAEPGVQWQGPLSWSSDGQWIALTGARLDQDGQRYVYLIPLDGSGPRALAGTRGAYSPEFSPTAERLAFLVSEGPAGGLTIMGLDGSGSQTTAWTEVHDTPPGCPAPGWTGRRTGGHWPLSPPPRSRPLTGRCCLLTACPAAVRRRAGRKWRAARRWWRCARSTDWARPRTRRSTSAWPVRASPARSWG